MRLNPADGLVPPAMSIATRWLHQLEATSAVSAGAVKPLPPDMAVFGIDLTEPRRQRLPVVTESRFVVRTSLSEPELEIRVEAPNSMGHEVKALVLSEKNFAWINDARPRALVTADPAEAPRNENSAEFRLFPLVALELELAAACEGGDRLERPATSRSSTTLREFSPFELRFRELDERYCHAWIKCDLRPLSQLWGKVAYFAFVHDHRPGLVIGPNELEPLGQPCPEVRPLRGERLKVGLWKTPAGRPWIEGDRPTDDEGQLINTLLEATGFGFASKVVNDPEFRQHVRATPSLRSLIGQFLAIDPVAARK